MKLNQLNLVYFSPTGTTRKVIMAVSQKIDLKSVSYDLTVHKEKDPVLSFKSDDFVIFGIPVYSGRVPKTYLEYFKTLKGCNTPAALVATYGCRAYEDALIELKTVVEEKGFKVIGAGAFPVEHSIVRSVGRGRPDKDDLRTISEYGIGLNRKIKNLDTTEHVSLTVSGNSEYRKYSTIPFVPHVAPDYCNECKTCAKGCPSGAISMENPKKTDKDKCISCMRCMRICPKHARYVSKLKMNFAEKKIKKACQGDRKEAEIFL